MSLINEALKKAQRQRSLDSAPLSAAPSGVAAAAVTTHVRSASHRRSHAPIWFGLGLLGLGVVATVLVMRYGFTSAEPAKPAAVAQAPALAPVPAAPAPVAVSASTASPAPAPLVVLPPIPQIAPVSQPVANVTQSPAPAPGAPAAASSTAVAPIQEAAPTTSPAPTPVAPVAAPAALTPAEREAQVYAFLNAIRLTGVRGLDREARVLMNERVWRLNDMVSPELGLRLSAVRPNLLVFTDTQGRTYEKPY